MEETMDYNLQNKVAMVTGAASQVGIGKAVCLTLAKEGCDIVSVDIDLEGAKKTAELVKALGRKAIALKVDVTKSSEIEEMTKVALKEFGKIDILVNNAGGNAVFGESFLESKQETWEKNMALNLYGTMSFAKVVLPGMIQRKYGKIINFASIVAKIGGPSSYGASKAAVLAFTRGLATEYGPSGINVNAVAPGMVVTNFYAANKQMNFESMAARAPLRRNQTVEDMANAVAFLASDMSKNITGQCIQVDSGMVML